MSYAKDVLVEPDWLQDHLDEAPNHDESWEWGSLVNEREQSAAA